jgi:hypothetical protein
MTSNYETEETMSTAGSLNLSLGQSSDTMLSLLNASTANVNLNPPLVLTPGDKILEKHVPPQESRISTWTAPLRKHAVH